MAENNSTPARSRHAGNPSSLSSSANVGTVYLLHFEPPYRHAGHYVGFVEGGRAAVRDRLERHLSGNGSRLVEVVSAAGCVVKLARIWRHRDRHFERGLKKRHGFHSIRELCPICRELARIVPEGRTQ